MSTDPHTDDEMIRQAYRAAAQAEPSPQLDAHILQAAHAALKTPAHKPARWSWLVLPLSAAAVAILVTTLVLQPHPAPSTPPLETASTSAPSQGMQPETAQPSSVAEAAKPAPEFQVADATAAKNAQDRKARPASSAAAKPDQQRMQAATDEAAAQVKHRNDIAALTGAAEQAKQKTQETTIAAIEPAAPTPALAAAKPSGAIGPSAAASSPSPSAAMRQAPLSDKMAETENPQTSARSIETLGALAKAPNADKPTAKQLEEIRKLQRKGKLDAAKKALAELLKAFPQYPVPEDLRALIEPGPKIK